jgi:hypothetical protein
MVKIKEALIVPAPRLRPDRDGKLSKFQSIVLEEVPLKPEEVPSERRRASDVGSMFCVLRRSRGTHRVSFPTCEEANMLKRLMVTTAITGLMIGAAAAQTSQPSMPSQDKPAATAPAPSGTASGSAQFINSQSADQWLSSNFMGTDVVGPDDAKIGDVTDILFEKDGKVVGYVVGVGGFLGIGTKNVALAPSSFQIVPASAATTGAGTTGAARSDDIKLKLNMTKDQLQQAAAFESKRDQEAKARASSPSSNPGGSPRPAGSPSR